MPDRERADDWRHAGMLSLTANINRNVKAKPQPFSPADFVTWMEVRDPEPVRLESAKAQSDFIKAVMFGRVKGNKT